MTDALTPLGDELDWIADLQRQVDAMPLGGPPAPPNCRVCDQPVDLTDEEFYATPRRKTCRACLREQAAERRRASLALTIPPRYEWARLASSELPGRIASGMPTDERLEEIFRSQRVVFVGKAGSGKTSLAVALLREMARRGADAMFVSAYRLATERARHPLGEGDPPMLEAAADAGVLLIDDIGNERHTELSDVRALVFERHDFERTVWTTTSLSSGALATMYGGGFVRRLLERAVVVVCDVRNDAVSKANTMRK